MDVGGSRGKAGSASRALEWLLSNPLAGLSPWIVYTLTSGPDRLELASLLALALAATLVIVSRLRGGTVKALELSDVVFFAALAIFVALASDSTYGWLELWSGEIANLALATIGVGSILLRRPFTLAYARETTPRELWDNPSFLHSNYVITGVWAAAFVIAAAAGAYGDAVLDNSNNLWTGWIIQTLPMIWAIQFTSWYPDVVRARGRAAQGIAGDPAPPMSELLAGSTAWLTGVGILVLAIGGGPVWLGVALIVVGAVLTHRFAGEAREFRRQHPTEAATASRG